MRERILRQLEFSFWWLKIKFHRRVTVFNFLRATARNWAQPKPGVIGNGDRLVAFFRRSMSIEAIAFAVLGGRLINGDVAGYEALFWVGFFYVMAIGIIVWAMLNKDLWLVGAFNRRAGQ